MSTAAQVAELVQPFLRRHPEFVLVGRRVVIRPVNHLMRSFFLDRTSAKAHVLASWEVKTMFAPPPDHQTGAGARLSRGFGYLADAQTQARLIDEMELLTSELLSIATIEDLPALGWKAVPMHTPRPMAFAMPLLARGAFAEALVCFKQALAQIDEGTERRRSELAKHRSPESRAARLANQLLSRQLEYQMGYGRMCALLSGGDAQAIAKQLHEWEAAAVRLHKVEHLWEPTRFPFELGTGS